MDAADKTEVPAAWPTCSYREQSSRLDKLRIAPTHQPFRDFLANHRRFAASDDISKAEHSGAPGTYGPFWAWMWKEVFSNFLPVLGDISKRRRLEGFEDPTVLAIQVFSLPFFVAMICNLSSSQVNGEDIITPALLAFFDCVVTTSPWAHGIKEAEQRTKVPFKVEGLEREHASAEARKNLRELFAAKGW